MGIPGLSAFLRQQYPQAFVKLDESPSPWASAHVYFDLNYILHYCSGRQRLASPVLADAEVDKFASDVLEAVLWYVETLREGGLSASSVAVAIDGPPSVRKFQEQRDRRRSRLAKKGDDDIAADDLIGLALTPGTDFMGSLSVALQEKLQDRLDAGDLPTPVSFWDSNAPGEGEHKIAAAIVDRERSDGPASHVIVGGDADLVVIAMTLSGGLRGEVGVYSEDLFVASRLSKALGLPAFSIGPTKLGSRGSVGQAPVARGSIGALLAPTDSVRQPVDVQFKSSSADFAFLALLGGNDYLAAAVKRPKKGSKSHMDWLLAQYTSLRASFMRATKAAGPGGGEVWEFQIARPDVLARLLSGDEGASVAPSPSEEDVENSEAFLMGVLWAISTFANGCVPSFLSTCATKASAWTIVEYLRAEPARARALRVAYSPDAACPLCPLAVAACVLPWRQPVLELLGSAGPAVQSLVQEEFEDLYAFEEAHDARQVAWARDGVWDARANLQAPEGLAGRDLEGFDARVRELAEAAGAPSKAAFSDRVLLHAAQADGERCGGRAPPAKRRRTGPASVQGSGAAPVSREHAPQDGCDLGQCSAGDIVEGFWPDESCWLLATLIAIHEDGSCRIAWAEDASESDVPADFVRPCGAEASAGYQAAAPEFAAGDAVEAFWPDDEVWLAAMVREAYPDGSFRIAWRADETESDVPADGVRAAEHV